jgi:hypothetical protein
LLVRIIISVIFAGIFYTGWMAVAVPTLKAEPIYLKILCWLAAPLATAAGFACGVLLFELLPGTKKSKSRDIIFWPLAGCIIGAVIVVFFGPMLIVFGMFALGAAGILIKEIVAIKKSH